MGAVKGASSADNMRAQAQKRKVAMAKPKEGGIGKAIAYKAPANRTAAKSKSLGGSSVSGKARGQAMRVNRVKAVSGTKRAPKPGLNLNPFDPKNSISAAGRAVAKNIPAGIGNQVLKAAHDAPGNAAQSVANAVKEAFGQFAPQDMLMKQVGNRITRATKSGK